MSTTTDKAAKIGQLTFTANNCLRICQLEMAKNKPELGYAFEFAEKALEAISTLRIMTIGGRA